MNHKFLQKYRYRVATESSWDLQRHPEVTRYSSLAIYLYLREQEIIDSLIELLIQVVHRLSTRAEKKVVKELLRDFKKVYGKTTLLYKIAEATVNKPNGRVKDVVYPIADETTLINLVKEYKLAGNGYQKQVHTIMRSSYSNHYRRMLPKILVVLNFRSNNVLHRPVLDALEWITRNKENSQRYVSLDVEVPLDGVIRTKWWGIVIKEDENGDKRINRINYEISVLQALRERLRCKEIWVVGADKYRNPDDDLPHDFDEKRENYYQELSTTTSAYEFISTLKQQMQNALTNLNATIPNNKKAKILSTGKNKIRITPLEAQEKPMNLRFLKKKSLIDGRCLVCLTCLRKQTFEWDLLTVSEVWGLGKLSARMYYSNGYYYVFLVWELIPG